MHRGQEKAEIPALNSIGVFMDKGLNSCTAGAFRSLPFKLKLLMVTQGEKFNRLIAYEYMAIQNLIV